MLPDSTRSLVLMAEDCSDDLVAREFDEDAWRALDSRAIRDVGGGICC